MLISFIRFLLGESNGSIPFNIVIFSLLFPYFHIIYNTDTRSTPYKKTAMFTEFMSHMRNIL